MKKCKGEKRKRESIGEEEEEEGERQLERKAQAKTLLLNCRLGFNLTCLHLGGNEDAHQKYECLLFPTIYSILWPISLHHKCHNDQMFHEMS